jgi:hypothetical protein
VTRPRGRQGKTKPGAVSLLGAKGRRAQIFNVDMCSGSRSTRQWAKWDSVMFFGIFPIFVGAMAQWALAGFGFN